MVLKLTLFREDDFRFCLSPFLCLLHCALSAYLLAQFSARRLALPQKSTNKNFSTHKWTLPQTTPSTVLPPLINPNYLATIRPLSYWYKTFLKPIRKVFFQEDKNATMSDSRNTWAKKPEPTPDPTFYSNTWMKNIPLFSRDMSINSRATLWDRGITFSPRIVPTKQQKTAQESTVRIPTKFKQITVSQDSSQVKPSRTTKVPHRNTTPELLRATWGYRTMNRPTPKTTRAPRVIQLTRAPTKVAIKVTETQQTHPYYFHMPMIDKPKPTKETASSTTYRIPQRITTSRASPFWLPWYLRSSLNNET